MKLSILIPAYNVEGVLPRCLDSILKQDVDEVEVLLVDDGSSDRTLKVLGNMPRTTRACEYSQNGMRGLVLPEISFWTMLEESTFGL